IIAIVMGSRDRKIRDAKAKELLARGFAMVPSKPATAVAAALTKPDPEKTGASVPVEQEEAVSVAKNEAATPPAHKGGWTKFFAGIAVGFALFAVLALFALKITNRKSGKSRLRF
ncbi:MAG: D-alanyl-D-alanine carboxypeptidase, partial [Desulfobulbaceae bacterium]|nr:D-alanyl-D-alanine carboxypeptidase [Desulfobulbaceae bacterium]